MQKESEEKIGAVATEWAARRRLEATNGPGSDERQAGAQLGDMNVMSG